jgi:Transcriptional regulator, AbiEi antitoxin, Type IV TA system/Transcriptional regulator, AbiEi antitoxin N-terminal domain
MGMQNGSKLNRLQHDLPEGLVVDAAWLERHGYSRALRSKYAAHGWLEQVARGVYRRPTASPPSSDNKNKRDGRLRWQHVVVSLQTILELPLVVGGRTALELQGFAHYLGSGELREVHLYGTERPPTWLDKLKLETHFVFHNAKRLFTNQMLVRGAQGVERETESQSGTRSLGAGLIQQPWGQWDWPLTLSSPERAILELLDEVPQRETFHQADMLMEGLRTLSPKRLQKLLVDCRSVKVKRLFFWFAERHSHAWLKQLRRDEINLGAGKRMLERGGKLDPKYNITVPENLDAGR